MQILLDLLIWFNGVEILWPIPSWVNLWTNVTPPEWWSKLILPVENPAFVFFFLFLAATARKRQTDIEYLPKLRLWTIVQAVLFVVFLILVFTMERGFMTIFGAVYLLLLGLAFGITIRMRDTVEAPALAAVPVCTDGKFLIELDNEGRKRMMKRYYLRMENSNNKFEGVYKRKKIDIPEIQGIPLGSWVWCLNCYKAGEFRLIVGSQMFPFIVV